MWGINVIRRIFVSDIWGLVFGCNLISEFYSTFNHYLKVGNKGTPHSLSETIWFLKFVE